MLIVEDGTGTNPAVNSYGSIAGLVDYADQRGETLPGIAVVGEAIATVTAGQTVTLANLLALGVTLIDSSGTPKTLSPGTDYSVVASTSAVTINNIAGFTQPFLASYTAVTVRACEVLMLKAMNYLEDLNFKGFRFKQFQARKWPRYDVIIDGWPLLINQIPFQLLYAQYAFAIEYQTVDLMPTAQPWDHGSVASDAISGAVSESYEDNARVIYIAAVEKARAWVKDIVRNEGMRAIRG